MNAFVNPLGRTRSASFPEHSARIKTWLREALSLSGEVISVNELSCSQPGCPPRQTVLLILGDNTASRKFTLHKSLLDIVQEDILEMIQRES